MKKSKHNEKRSSNLGLFGEFWEFLADNKKFWCIPIILIIIFLGIVAYLGGPEAAPFVYSIFD